MRVYRLQGDLPYFCPGFPVLPDLVMAEKRAHTRGMSPKLLLWCVFLSFPLSADPLFDLYNCKGRESTCLALFPGEAAKPDGGRYWHYTLGDRVNVNGIDLGPAWLNQSSSEPTFAALYLRDSLVIGWQFCCDGDEDGHLVTWQIDNGTATLQPREYLSGDRPYIRDVNSKGQFVGQLGPLGGSPYINGEFLPAGPEFEPYMFSWSEDAQLVRINEEGHALGFATYVDVEAQSLERRMFVVAPAGQHVEGLHAPEPSSLLLFAGAAVLIGLREAKRIPLLRSFPSRSCK